MDLNTKSQLKGELKAIQAQTTGINGLAAAAGGQIAYPLPMGGVVTINAFIPLSQAIKMQSDAIDKLCKLVEKVIDQA